MVSIKSLALAGLAVAGSYAAPMVEERSSDCMTAAEALTLATDYGTLIANYTKTLANEVLTKDFHDYSESVNTLINQCPTGDTAAFVPLLGATFTSRKAFEAGQGSQAAINFNMLEHWPSCCSVSIRWESTNTAPIPSPRPVVGIIVAETKKVHGTWRIDTVYSEFDVAAWLENLQAAGFCPTTTASSTVSATATPTSSVAATTVATTAASATASA